MKSKFWPALILGAAALFAALCVIQVARAAGPAATLTWTHPTANTDNSPLAVSDIKETVIIWRRPGNSSIVGTVHVAAPATSAVVPGLTCGSFNFTAQTVVVVQSVASVESNSVLYATGVQCAPNPPTGVTAT